MQNHCAKNTVDTVEPSPVTPKNRTSIFNTDTSFNCRDEQISKNSSGDQPRHSKKPDFYVESLGGDYQSR